MVYYLALDEKSIIKLVIAAIGKKHRETSLLVPGNLNANLSDPKEHARDEAILAALETEGFKNMADHFLPCHLPWNRDSRMWNMLICGLEVQLWMDYIIGTYHRLFQNVAI